MSDNKELESLLVEIRSCTICSEHLPLGSNPVLSAHSDAPIAIIGQAPGTKVHKTGIPWNDPSGDRLRKWLDVSREDFYNPTKFAITPMGFCYPGKGKSGDLPPRPECAATWHSRLMDQLPNLKLIILIGQYAQNYYLPSERKSALTEKVKRFENFLPRYFPLPHPSPRNQRWFKINPWFANDVLPVLHSEIRKYVSL